VCKSSGRSLASSSPAFDPVTLRQSEFIFQRRQEAQQSLLGFARVTLREFRVSGVLEGSVGQCKELRTAQETMARDFPSPLANVFDRHPPLEVLFEEVADQPLRAVSATPSDNIETKQSRRDDRRDEDDPCAAHY
jgi:hypothetical protein